MRQILLLVVLLTAIWHTPAWAQTTDSPFYIPPLRLDCPRYGPRLQGDGRAPAAAAECNGSRPIIVESLQPFVFRTPSESAAALAARSGDSVGNGIAAGAAIGAAGSLALVGVMYARCDAGCEAPAFSSIAAPAIAFGAGVGALVGYLIDRAR